jgi:hypothetical protein
MAEIKKTLYAQVIKQTNGQANSRDIQFVLSDETPDSDGDIIRVAGWDLNRFLTNAICMGFHEYDTFPFGEWHDVRKDFRSPNGIPRLVGTLHFPTIEELCPSGQVTEHAKNVDMACAMVNAGYLNAVSVGCYYKEYTPREDYPEGTPEYMRGRDVTSAELLECSLVPLPANPNALSLLSADKNIDKKMVEYITKSFKEHTEAQEAEKKAREDSEAAKIIKPEGEDKAVSEVVTKVGARLSGASTTHIDNLEKCVKSMIDDANSLNDKCTKALTHIQMLRDGAAPEELDDGDVTDDGVKSVKGFVFHLVK